MKVWIVFTGDYDQRDVDGVYATKEQAVAAAMPDALAWRAQMERAYPEQAAKWKPVTEANCDIEEHEVIEG